MTTHPDILRLLPESWITPPQQFTSSAPLDMWGKFDIEHDRALAVMDHTMTFPTDIGDFIPGDSNMPHHMGVPPTPPHSPPTEHDLDDLVASIPEILESPSATPPSDISDILSDLEGMEMKPMFRAPGYSWWNPVAPPVPEVSLKRDIMWGGGTCCPALLEPPIKKERQVSECSVSECSADAALLDALKHEDISEDDDDSEDNLPDTPSGTDSDCDADDHMSETSSSSGSPRSTNSASRYSTSSAVFWNSSCAPYMTPSVNSEHNYCGRVPEPDAHNMEGILTPSDTEDEVDVVTCSDPNEAATTTTISLGNYTIVPSPSSSSSSPANTTPTFVPSKRSVDVKRQLQLAIQEAMRNRQNRAAGSSPESDDVASNRFVSVKIKTQGKPAAYTKRMRDYHTEVIKSTKHRRRNRVESDEGRRSVHNSLERQRRVDLRNAFEYLRQLVPDTKILEKAPKVQILKKAALHCKQLHLTELRLLKEKEKLKKQLEELQQRRLQSS